MNGDIPVDTAAAVEVADSAPTPAATPNRTPLWLVALSAAAAAMVLWRSPRDASQMLIVPDAVEYAVGAQRFATLGRFDIVVDGISRPSMYPPLFSTVLLAPVYWLAPGEIGNGILVVFLFAVLATALAGHLAGRIGGAWASAGAVLSLLYLPTFTYYAQVIMTDVPVAALMLISLALFLRGWRKLDPATVAAAGLAAAIAAGLRPLSAAMLLPWIGLIVSRRPASWRYLPLLLGPIALTGLAGLLYNHHTFGQWGRTGYQYWSPIPYESLSLVFSPRYLMSNLREAALDRVPLALILGAAGLTVMFLKQDPRRLPLSLFFFAGVVPVSLVHLVYYFPSNRFHLGVLVICCILMSSGAALLLPSWLRRRPWTVLILALLALTPPEPMPPWQTPRAGADELAAATKGDAVIVTALDPVFFDATIGRGTRRRWVAASRDVDYAAVLIAPHPLNLRSSGLTAASSSRDPRLRSLGAIDPVAWTADERPDALESLARSGTPVYLDAHTVNWWDPCYQPLAARFEFRPVRPGSNVIQLIPR